MKHKKIDLFSEQPKVKQIPEPYKTVTDWLEFEDLIDQLQSYVNESKDKSYSVRLKYIIFSTKLWCKLNKVDYRYEYTVCLILHNFDNMIRHSSMDDEVTISESVFIPNNLDDYFSDI